MKVHLSSGDALAVYIADAWWGAAVKAARGDAKPHPGICVLPRPAVKLDRGILDPCRPVVGGTAKTPPRSPAQRILYLTLTLRT